MIKFVDALIVSAEVEAAKPDPAVFMAALQRIHCQPREAVMVGDSWEQDILGAVRAGIRAVWLNRFGLLCPDSTLAAEINSFTPIEKSMSVIANYSIGM